MAVIKKYCTEVVSVENPLTDIYTVSFRSKNGRFRYNPGQFLHLTLEEYDPALPWPESRCFSMQSSPSEESLKITFAVKGAYTKRMAEEILPGKEIWLKLPYGDIFGRGHSTDNCVFIAGGTGVTPFISLFTDSSFVQYHHPKLYLGLKDKEYDIFYQDVQRANLINKEFCIFKVYQSKSGNLNIEELYKANPNSTYFISGPPKMIRIFKEYLITAGVEPTKVLTDEWD